MAFGNAIVVENNPKGVFLEGTMDGTPKPGTMMELKPATVAVGGKWTYRVYQPGTDGERRLVAILLEDSLQGKLATDAYVTGTRCFMYCPAMGEEMNVLKGDVAGTGDDLAIGDMLIADTGTGKFIKTTGSPESEPFECLETVTDPTADQLIHVRYTGH